MSAITILSTRFATRERRVIAANGVIAQYDLHFRVDDLIKALEYFHEYHHFKVIQYVMHLMLTTNLRLFIALVYALLDNKMLYGEWCYLRTWKYGHVKLGYNHPLGNSEAKQVYCMLYDYYEFDITELELSEELREHIQTHINSKFNNTKRAIKK